MRGRCVTLLRCMLSCPFFPSNFSITAPLPSAAKTGNGNERSCHRPTFVTESPVHRTPHRHRISSAPTEPSRANFSIANPTPPSPQGRRRRRNPMTLPTLAILRNRNLVGAGAISMGVRKGDEHFATGVNADAGIDAETDARVENESDNFSRWRSPSVAKAPLR